MKIDIPWIKPVFYGKEKDFLIDAFDSTWISGGRYVEKFEKDFARYNGSKHCLGVLNGTAALQLALTAFGIGSGDEVIVPGFTFVAPINMVIAVGARPVYADIDPLTWCIDPVSINKAITKKTKAIIAVNIYGNVCDMGAIKKIARERGIFLIEDNAEAIFSKYKNKYAGTFGDIGCFSFHAAKTIAMGEGGCVLTNNTKLYKKMRSIHSHGMRPGKRYWHDRLGFNFRLTNLQAAIGCGQLENVKNIIKERKRVYDAYCEQLADEPGITLQYFMPEVFPVVWAFAVKIEPSIFKGGRDFIIKKMFDFGVETRPGFYPFSAMPFYGTTRLRACEKIGLNTVCLPFYSTLTENTVKFICDKLKNMRK